MLRNAVLLPLALAAPLALVAPSAPAAGDPEAEVEEVAEERAEEENEGGRPEDADVGEASYNVADCSPAGEEEIGDEVERADLDEECEPLNEAE